MTDEELKNLKVALDFQSINNSTFDIVNYPVRPNSTRKKLLELIEAEQQKRAVRSEDVQRAIEFQRSSLEQIKNRIENLNDIKKYYDQAIEIGEPLDWKWEDSWTKYELKDKLIEAINTDLAIQALETYQPKESCGLLCAMSKEMGKNYCSNCGKALKGD